MEDAYRTAMWNVLRFHWARSDTTKSLPAKKTFEKACRVDVSKSEHSLWIPANTRAKARPTPLHVVPNVEPFIDVPNTHGYYTDVSPVVSGRFIAIWVVIVGAEILSLLQEYSPLAEDVLEARDMFRTRIRESVSRQLRREREEPVAPTIEPILEEDPFEAWVMDVLNTPLPLSVEPCMVNADLGLGYYWEYADL